MKRPILKEISLENLNLKGQMVVTMNKGQWDMFLEKGYENGAILLEVDDNEIPIKAYKKD